MLPHIQNSEAGRNLYDPVFKQIFELDFDLPEALVAQFGGDRAIITEHVTKISGLAALDKTVETGKQQFMGTDRSYLKPHLDSTRAEFEVELNLNLRNGTDNYIYKIFRAWSRLGYNIQTGERHLKKDCCAKWLKIRIANQRGDIYREVVFKDVMMNGPVTGMHEDLDYSSDDAQTLTVKFVSDWWTDDLA